MIAEIISIGDELLIGQTVNTNSSFIARQLTDIGISIDWITTVGDELDRIKKALSLAETRADVIITTGGLGPTHDDITKKAFSEYFDVRLILDENVLENLRARFARRKMKLTKSNQGQALVPEGASVINNPVGTAPGLLLEREKKYFLVLPGVPVEMEAITIEFIVPFLKTKNTQSIRKRTLHTAGIPESYLFERLGDVAALEKIAKIAFLPEFGRVDIRITATGTSEQECLEKIAQVEKYIRHRVDKNIWGVDEETFEKVIIDMFKQRGLTLSVAELGTRGEIISLLTRDHQPDSYFVQGVVVGAPDYFWQLFHISENELLLSDISDSKKMQKLAEIIRRRTNSDITLLVIFRPDVENNSLVIISGPGETQIGQHSFPFKPDILIQRLAATALFQLYQFLQAQKFA